MSKVFLVDIARCNGCHNCQVACKDEHCEQTWLPYAQAQPLTGHFWMRVDEQVRGQAPVVKTSYTPVFCAHCAKAPCMVKGGDSMYRREDGLVLIDPTKAVGRKDLVSACPLGAIYYNDALDLPQKCTGCAHLLDNGWEVPRCVDACATEALRYVEEEDVETGRAELLSQTACFSPKVFYFNLPKRFIAGLVMDETAQEVAIDVEIALTDSAGTIVASTCSDEFGDYCFDQMEPAIYTVVIRPDTDDEIRLVADVREQDLYVGDTNIF
jgi:Fe-S-cluster-containing dehydrogenase component